MRNRPLHRLLPCIACLSGLLLTAVPVIAATDDAAAPERYRVELIIFRHVDQSRNTLEIPAAASIFRPSPLDLTIVEMPAQFPDRPAEPLGIPGNNPGKRTHRTPIYFHLLELTPTYPDFAPMRDDTRTLNQVYERLEKIDAYEPIMHIGWVQPVRDSGSAKPYRFPLPASGPATEPAMDSTGITGTITLYKGRFLHLEVDLTLDVEKLPVETWSFLGASVNDSPDTYKLTESRRIRGSDAHYFDHPHFGVIAKIRRVETASTAREENG